MVWGRALDKVSSTIEEDKKQPTYALKGTFEEPVSSVKGLTKEIVKDLEFLSVVVDTSKWEVRIRTNNKDFDPLVFPISETHGGVAEPGEGKQGDKKMPKGEFVVRGARLPEGDPMEEFFTKYDDRNISYGPAFVYTDARDEKGEVRGIGFHGSHENDLGRKTNGCIRLLNDDLLLIREKLTIGLLVSII